ncbi:hypothetical protein BZA05DRAFT_400262 [Tricharina praecox]|uniref:uncharacterized protein n=1 Tax=Tricharina praecox TaxID=43433 RepID=UPI00221E7F14|nr:uncharacterized protein BZA05DRAFT_400262 [Tricharina praecox]KAI5849920.1 hypothetical protein BZA05DRAFT_400262 [Tricharina praecox]
MQILYAHVEYSTALLLLHLLLLVFLLLLVLLLHSSSAHSPIRTSLLSHSSPPSPFVSSSHKSFPRGLPTTEARRAPSAQTTTRPSPFEFVCTHAACACRFLSRPVFSRRTNSAAQHSTTLFVGSFSSAPPPRKRQTSGGGAPVRVGTKSYQMRTCPSFLLILLLMQCTRKARRPQATNDADLCRCI